MKKLNLASKILLHITVVLFILLSVAGPLMINYSTAINTVLGIQTSVSSGGDGNSTYFDTKFENMSQVRKASFDIIEEVMSEGAVLLKNNGALPLKNGDKVTLYGHASYYSVFCGQGSGGIEGKNSLDGSAALKDAVRLSQGLKNAGLTVNDALNTFYGEQSPGTYLGGDAFSGGAVQQSQFAVKDIAWSQLPSARSEQAQSAIMVLARNSGEAKDLYMNTVMEDGSVTKLASVGDALTLTENEKSVLTELKSLKDAGTIKSVVVIMNSASPLQCEFIDNADYGIDACLWVGTLGSTGANAIGKLLTGAYDPSGRASDTFWSNSKFNPVYYNFGEVQYKNASVLNDYKDGNNKYYAVYQEGIYNGYRYTETRYEDVVTGRPKAGSFDYKQAVSFPFGYGLSYTSFEYSDLKVTYNAGSDSYTVTVDVSNVGGVDGKEAVQIYLQKPYTAKDAANGVEKSAVELVGFTKAYVPVGETVTATVEVAGKLLAAYDADVEKTYVIGSDNTEDKYLFTAAKDAHDAINNILKYKQANGVAVDETKMCAYAGRGAGNADLVWGKYIVYDNTTYSTNEFIRSENASFSPSYPEQKANYGVDKITNRFEDTDFKKAKIFSTEEIAQPYTTRSDWEGTCGKRISLTANNLLKAAQVAKAPEKDNVPYPTYDKASFYESDDDIDEIKLIYLRGRDYNDPLWDSLLDRMTREEVNNILQDGYRHTKGVESIAAPGTSQQNGGLAPNHSRDYGELDLQSGFQGFSKEKDPEHRGQIPAVFTCNGIVASTFNLDLIERLGEQTGEEAAWAGYNGIYGLGVNIHRGAYCGRQFEYYSEDGFLTGIAAGYEAVGVHKLGVFVLMKHAVLNDQETHRAGINVWANEQSIREIYSRAIEIAVDIDRKYTPCTVVGIMTGMNRLGATWTGAQGFCNTVLRAEYGMRGYIISDYNSTRSYMGTVQGVLGGNDLPDGTPTGQFAGYDYDKVDLRFSSYESGYGELAWAMRTSAKNVLYTVVNSNAVNGMTGNTSIKVITPAWQKAVPIVTRVSLTVLIWSACIFGLTYIALTVKAVIARKKTADSQQTDN